MKIKRPKDGTEERTRRGNIRKCRKKTKSVTDLQAAMIADGIVQRNELLRRPPLRQTRVGRTGQASGGDVEYGLVGSMVKWTGRPDEKKCRIH